MTEAEFITKISTMYDANSTSPSRHSPWGKFTAVISLSVALLVCGALLFDNSSRHRADVNEVFHAVDGSTAPVFVAPVLVAAVQVGSPLISNGEMKHRLSPLIVDAAKKGAKYVTAPEPVSLLGQPDAEDIPGPTTEHFGKLAREHNVWISVSLFEKANETKDSPNGSYVTTILINAEGEIVSKYRKVMVSDGAQPIRRGDFRTILHCIDDQGFNIGIVAGDDITVSVPRLAERGADLILISADWRDREDSLLELEGLSNACSVNLVAGTNDRAAILLKDGQRHLGKSGIDQVITAQIPRSSDGWRIRSALGLPHSVPVPNDERVSPDLVELGRTLFTDPNLSSTGKIACSTCHHPERAFTNGKQFGEGVRGKKSRRNVPSLSNVAFRPLLRWDGYASSIENFVKYPLSGPSEMDFHYLDKVVPYLREQPRYRRAFSQILATDRIEFEHVEIAIATYLRSLISGDSPFDRYFYGNDATALDSSAKRGLALFAGKADCARCHVIGKSHALLMDYQYHFLGHNYSADDGHNYDLGLGGISTADFKGEFLTPSLRDVAITGPYMHDGSLATLEDVVEFFDAGGKLWPGKKSTLLKLSLTDREKRDLISFMNSLTGRRQYNPDGTVKQL